MGIVYEDVFNLDELFIETVIGALNKYFANDKCDTSFIEIRKNSVVYRVIADDLIAWLRTKHGIFYYPGMEAKYAKAEKRIPPFSERMKNDGALRALKKLHKIVTGVEVSDTADSPTLIASAIENDFAVLKQDLNKRKTEIKEVSLETLRNMTNEEYSRWARAEYAESFSRNTKRSDINNLIRDYCAKNDIIPPSPYLSDKACVEYLFSVVDLEREHRAAVGKQMVDDYKKNIMDHIRQEASLNGFKLPEKVDDEPLTIEHVFHDLLELMRIRGEELRILKSKCSRLNEIVGELNALNDEIKE